MKVEKINENKIRITLTLEELENREISLTDIEKNSSIAQELFIDLIEESNLDEEFALEGSQLFIEACSDNNNLFILTITKIDAIPELKKYNNLNLKNNKNRGTSHIVDYKVDSNIYAFSSIDKLLSLCEVTRKEKLYFGRNSLYKYKDSFYIIFNKSAVKNKRFLKTFAFISEYCDDYYSSLSIEASLKEKSKLVIENNAIQSLRKI